MAIASSVIDTETTDPQPLTRTSALDPPAAVLGAEGIGFDSNSGLEVVELSGSIAGQRTEVADVVVVVEEQDLTISAVVVVVVAAAAAADVVAEVNNYVRVVADAAGRSQSVVEVKVAEVAPAAAAAGVDVVG
jgi:hypothetical protein